MKEKESDLDALGIFLFCFQLPTRVRWMCDRLRVRVTYGSGARRKQTTSLCHCSKVIEP